MSIAALKKSNLGFRGHLKDNPSESIPFSSAWKKESTADEFVDSAALARTLEIFDSLLTERTPFDNVSITLSKSLP